MKKCKDCGLLKNINEFYTKYQGDCKECFKKAVRLYRLKNIDYIRQYDRKRHPIRYGKWKDGIYKLLGGKKCTKCGIEDERVLQIDHVNGGGRKERDNLKGNRDKKLLLIKNNPKNYQVLCANCNWIKRYENKEVPRQYYNTTQFN